MTARVWASGELVALGHRLRVLLGFRLAAAAVVVGHALAVPAAISPGPARGVVLAGSAGYAAIALLLDLAWRWWSGRALLLVGVLLVLDGGYLVGAAQLSGGDASPLRYLVIVHLIAVTLLASYRTGLKLALWHSLLLFVTASAEQSGLLAPPVGTAALPGTPTTRLVTFVTVFWLVAVSTAAFSAVNERELRRRRFDLEALAELSVGLESASESGAVAEVLAARLSDAFGCPRALVLAVEGETVRPLTRSGPGWQPGAGSVLAVAVRRHRTLLVTGLDPEVDGALTALLPGARDLVVVPMYADNRPVGVLLAEHGLRSGSRVERRVVSMIERFAAQAALALANARLLEQVRELAASDGLTGIANRRSFDLVLGTALAAADRSGSPVGLVLVDIDHFKRLNDTHGHSTGDEVLRQVAQLLAENARAGDTAARYGGEEFAVVMPGCDLPEALAVAERLGAAVRTAPTAVPVTVSLGVAVAGSPALDAARLIETADAGLYAAKRGGRDQVGCATSPAPDPAGTGALPRPAGPTPPAAPAPDPRAPYAGGVRSHQPPR